MGGGDSPELSLLILGTRVFWYQLQSKKDSVPQFVLLVSYMRRTRQGVLEHKCAGQKES